MNAVSKTYFPPADGGDWARAVPGSVGMNAGRLAEAVAFAEAHETAWPRSMYHPDGTYVGLAHVQEEGDASAVVGPVRRRGGAAGLVLRHGRIVAEWGDLRRADMTFSVAKSYLAILAGIALDRGLIDDLDAPVRHTADDASFAESRQRDLTWRQLLQQTSEWQGTLWGKPDSIDRNRQAGPGADNSRKGTARVLGAPGSVWEYNDVRVNFIALCLLRLFRRPLPEMLKETIMGPIGASSRWEWHGYETSWIEIDGRRIQSVSGGGHWGGGMFIDVLDHARFGTLVLRDGVWAGRRLLSRFSIEALREPCAVKPIYGLLWWLNTGRALHPSAPASSIFALGGGSNVIWLDPEHDLVMVARWIDKASVDALIGRVVASVAG